MQVNHDWIDEFPGAVTVTAADGTIVAMNRRAAETFAAEGGLALVGRNVLDCHPEPARTLTARLYSKRTSNHYTITSKGRRKMIHQVPWYRDGVFAGLVELSLEIPEELPHHDRDAQS